MIAWGFVMGFSVGAAVQIKYQTYNNRPQDIIDHFVDKLDENQFFHFTIGRTHDDDDDGHGFDDWSELDPHCNHRMN